MFSKFQEKLGGRVYVLKNIIGETYPELDMEIWSVFLSELEIVKLGLGSGNFLAWELGAFMKSHHIQK